MDFIATLAGFAFPHAGMLRGIEYVLCVMEIFATVRPRPWFPVEADQPFIVRGSIFLADVVKDTSLVEFGEIRLEVKIP